jgi:hypothetical protein
VGTIPTLSAGTKGHGFEPGRVPKFVCLQIGCAPKLDECVTGDRRGRDLPLDQLEPDRTTLKVVTDCGLVDGGYSWEVGHFVLPQEKAGGGVVLQSQEDLSVVQVPVHGFARDEPDRVGVLPGQG